MSDKSMWPNCAFLADSASVSWSQSDKTLLSPWGAPWVLNFPNSIYHTHQQDCVINVFSTVAENSWRIMRPSPSVHCHWNRSSFQSIHNSCASGWLWDCVDLESAALLFACLGDSFVWISWLWLDSMVLDVFQGTSSWASVAAVVSIRPWTVDQLLFRKIGCFAFK